MADMDRRSFLGAATAACLAALAPFADKAKPLVAGGLYDPSNGGTYAIDLCMVHLGASGPLLGKGLVLAHREGDSWGGMIFQLVGPLQDIKLIDSLGDATKANGNEIKIGVARTDDTMLWLKIRNVVLTGVGMVMTTANNMAVADVVEMISGPPEICSAP